MTQGDFVLMLSQNQPSAISFRFHWEDISNYIQMRENRLLDSGFIIEKKIFSTHWVLKENKKIVPEFSASISLPYSGVCAWADVTHRVTPWGHTRGGNNNNRRKIKEAIQIYKMQPALNRDQGMEIPAITLKLLSCGPTGSHDEWRQPTHIPLKMAARCSPKIREHFFFVFFQDSVCRKTIFSAKSLAINVIWLKL